MPITEQATCETMLTLRSPVVAYTSPGVHKIVLEHWSKFGDQFWGSQRMVSRQCKHHHWEELIPNLHSTNSIPCHQQGQVGNITLPPQNTPVVNWGAVKLLSVCLS